MQCCVLGYVASLNFGKAEYYFLYFKSKTASGGPELLPPEPILKSRTEEGRKKRTEV